MAYFISILLTVPDALVGHVEPVLCQLALALLLATPEGLVNKTNVFIFACLFSYLFHVCNYLIIPILLYLAVKKIWFREAKEITSEFRK